MMPISGVNTGAVQPLTTAEKVLGASKVQKSEEESQGRQLKPVMDEYVPEEPQEPSGRYWMGKDEDGQSKIYFDDPERAAGAPKQPEGAPDAKKPDADAPEEPDPAGRGAKGPERKKDKGETWECNTDQVDREIEKLKKKQQELEQQLNTETDEAKIKDLERQLSQVEQELKQKDSDTYRRQHAVYTQLS
ncbi:hypothetical protein D1646_04595 [Pseudoflavonifractor sp. 60]|uniref:hypothetical protein n=1 Tax=Pseudoflavonifractor sp. 60 TaxID=2304576 RepID=UPI00136E1934|nr:hypothetical protein [Pseudoflavonifractor sp. 60]NBI66102.1 hypothetical protein [Pseudoflavonifractor sp. 60]